MVFVYDHLILLQVVRITPQNTLFIAVSYEEHGKPQMIVVVSISNNTIIRITNLVGGSWTIALQHLQTYAYTISTKGKDLTGYMVSASKPVSVFSGRKRGQVLNYVGGDAMYVSLPPVSSLGKLHFIPSILERNLPDGYLVQVIAEQPTEVTNLITGSVITLGAREYHTSRLGDDGGEGMALECSQPCLVVQLTVGRTYDASKFDPSMRIIPNIESYIRSVSFTCHKANLLCKFMH